MLKSNYSGHYKNEKMKTKTQRGVKIAIIV